MSDQSYQSAVHMQRRCVALLARCASITTKLHAMQRLMPSLAARSEVMSVASLLPTVDEVSSMLDWMRVEWRQRSDAKLQAKPSDAADTVDVDSAACAHTRGHAARTCAARDAIAA
jgi:hypothetical protein